MNIRGARSIQKAALTHQGLFFRRPGDLMRAIECLNHSRIPVEVIDTQFAVIYEEVQKRRVLYEPYREEINPNRATCNILKNQTLHQMVKQADVKQFKEAKDWQMFIRSAACNGLVLEIKGQLGLKGLKSFRKSVSKTYTYARRKMEGNYFFNEGLFFKTAEDLQAAMRVLTEADFDGVALPTEIALIAFYVQGLLRGREEFSLNLLELASKIYKFSSADWKESLRKMIKKNVLEEVRNVYLASPNYYKKGWSQQFSSGEDFEVLKESFMDHYSPSLRPDLFKEPQLETIDSREALELYWTINSVKTSNQSLITYFSKLDQKWLKKQTQQKEPSTEANTAPTLTTPNLV